MKSIPPSSLVVVALTSTVISIGTVTTTTAQLAVDPATQCACPYDGFDERDCFVYGNPGTGLVAYPVAVDACINDIGAGNDYLDAFTFWRLCPYANYTDFNLEEFVNFLRFQTESDAAQFVMSQFIENMDFPIFTNASGTYTLVDTIVNNVVGSSFNCSSGESFQVNQCWNQVKEQMTSRTPRWNIVCRTWHAEMPARFLAEQGRARRLLCEGGFNASQLTFCQDVQGAVSNATDCESVANQAVPTAAQGAGVSMCGEVGSTPDPDGGSGAWSIAVTVMITITTGITALWGTW